MVPWEGLPKPSDAKEELELRAEIDAALAKVQDAYRRLDVEAATGLLQSLENARLSQLGCPEQVALAGRISFWLGVVYAAKKDAQKATERFTTVLAIDPASPIDAKYFPPATVALFEKVRKALGAGRTGGLSLSAEPEGATVYLNGRLAGQAPVTLTAVEGDHFVCVRRLGSKDWAGRMHLSAGRVDSQRIYLQRADAKETSSQLAALGGPLSLDNPAYVDALGAALAVDVVAELRAPAKLAWRSARPAGEMHEASAPADASTPDAAAQALADALRDSLGLLPRAPGPGPEESPAFRRLELEAGAAGGLALGPRPLGFLGGRLGIWWSVVSSLGFGLRLGVARGFGDVPLIALEAPNKPVLALASEELELPVSLAVRWHLLRASAFRFSAEVNGTFRLVALRPPVADPQLPPGVVTMPSPAPDLSLLMLGPHLGLSASYAVGPGVAFTLGFDYGLELGLSQTEVPVVFAPPPPAQPVLVPLTADPIRHLLSLDLGVQLRFE